MALHDPLNQQKNREWRRSVLVKARIRSPDGWHDASILNVSSRGLMIYSGCSTGPGALIELRGGDQIIRARVVWRKGSRAGLRSDGVLPVMDILSLAETPGARDDASPAPYVACRRARPRDVPCLRWPRLLELASVAGMGVLVAGGLVSVGGAAIIDRLGAIEAALRG